MTVEWCRSEIDLCILEIINDYRCITGTAIRKLVIAEKGCSDGMVRSRLSRLGCGAKRHSEKGTPSRNQYWGFIDYTPIIETVKSKSGKSMKRKTASLYYITPKGERTLRENGISVNANKPRLSRLNKLNRRSKYLEKMLETGIRLQSDREYRTAHELDNKYPLDLVYNNQYEIVIYSPAYYHPRNMAQVQTNLKVINYLITQGRIAHNSGRTERIYLCPTAGSMAELMKEMYKGGLNSGLILSFEHTRLASEILSGRIDEHIKSFMKQAYGAYEVEIPVNHYKFPDGEYRRVINLIGLNLAELRKAQSEYINDYVVVVAEDHDAKLIQRHLPYVLEKGTFRAIMQDILHPANAEEYVQNDDWANVSLKEEDFIRK